MSQQNWALVILVAVVLFGAYLRYCGTRVDLGRLAVVLMGIVLAVVILINTAWINQTAHAVATSLSHANQHVIQQDASRSIPTHRP